MIVSRQIVMQASGAGASEEKAARAAAKPEKCTEESGLCSSKGGAEGSKSRCSCGRQLNACRESCTASTAPRRCTPCGDVSVRFRCLDPGLPPPTCPTVHHTMMLSTNHTVPSSTGSVAQRHSQAIGIAC
jgi:hypothetical protein